MKDACEINKQEKAYSFLKENEKQFVIDYIESVLRSDRFYSDYKGTYNQMASLAYEVINQYFFFDEYHPLPTKYKELACFVPNESMILREGRLNADIKYSTHFITGFVTDDKGQVKRVLDDSKVESIQFLANCITSPDDRLVKLNDENKIYYYKKIHDTKFGLLTFDVVIGRTDGHILYVNINPDKTKNWLSNKKKNAEYNSASPYIIHRDNLPDKSDGSKLSPQFDSENQTLNQIPHTNIQKNPELPNNSEEKLSEGGGIVEKVEARLREKQSKKAFQDTERIGGSRKEMAAYRIISTSDLLALEEDELTAFELVKKEKVYPEILIPTEQDKGVSAGAAFLKVKMRTSFGASPPNNKDKRRVYVGFIEFLVKKFENIITVKEFEKNADEVMSEGLDTIIKILNPETYERVMAEKEEMAAQAEIIGAAITKLEEEQKVWHEKVKSRYPHLQTEHNFNWLQVPNTDADKEEYRKINVTIHEKKKELQKYEREVNTIANDFIQHTLGTRVTYFSMRSATKSIFEEIFGIRFVNFITRHGTSTVQLTYEEARGYEAISLEESEELTEQNTKLTKAHLDIYRNDLEFLSGNKTQQELNDFFSGAKGEAGFWGYAHHTHSNYEDVKSSVEGIEWYKKMYIHYLEARIKVSEKKIVDTIDKYKPRENDWSWATPKKNVSKGEKSELTINKGIPLSYIKRTKGYLITDADVGVESIKEKFGFKDVEFGQSIKDIEAREHIRHFLGAMADLGDILDLNLIKLNQIGDLKITFASRGSGGASAHYESLRKLINLTKSRGDGSVAHEYAHYIDNILPKIDNTEYKYTDWASVTRVKGYRGSVSIVNSVKNRAVANSVKDIFNYIYNNETPYRVGNKEPIYIKEIIYASPKQFGISSSIIGDTIEEYFKNFLIKYPQYKLYENLTKSGKEVLGFIVNKFGYKSFEFEFETKKTAYYAYSSKMSSDYWTRDWELFARAWECYIYDKLEKAGRTNNYLVSGGYFGSAYRVYPQGLERQDLFVLYEKFIETMKREYNLSGFVKFTEERSDEYLDLEEKKSEEKVTTGLIVDSVTNEVIEKISSDKTNIKGKLRELMTLLHEEKLERGGKIGNENTITDNLIKHCGCNQK